MQRRRFLLTSGAALGAAISPLWADIGDQLYLSAASKGDRSTWLVGVEATGHVRFSLPLPGRGHAAAAHPERAEAIVFARRPGRFAMVLDCASGQILSELHAPEGRHFYGHGVFSADGQVLFTTENDFDGPDGRIGVWDAANGYRRLGEFASGGIGPHEIVRLCNGHLAVANGGIQTHPDYGRKKLNIPTMRTNLTVLSPEGAVTASYAFPETFRQNSIRHLDIGPDGRVFAALQWQGMPTKRVPLVAEFHAGRTRFLDHKATARLKAYAGSIAVSGDGSEIAVTGPKGGHMLIFDKAGQPITDMALSLASGVAKTNAGLLITCAQGLARREGGGTEVIPVSGGWSWDNHLVRV